MAVEIKEVLTSKDLKKWVRFPNKLYHDNENFVPFLENDEIETFSLDKNPAYAFCETKLFLAYKDGEIVGRIAALINRAYNEKWNKNAVRFTRFDFIDDYEVSEALFSAVVEYGKSKGLTSAMGPIGFTDMDHEGMLVEGFDEFNMSITFYNHPYYLEHMERLGLKKDIDWIEYKISVPSEINPMLERISKHLIETRGFKIVTYTDRKILHDDALEAFRVIDIASSKLYGTVPLTSEIIANAVNAYIPLVNLDYIAAVKNFEGDIIAFGVMVPSIARALKKSNGKLLPLGIVRMLHALRGKNDTLEMYFVATSPEYQMQGVPALLITTLLEKLIKNGVKYCETGPMLETNAAVHSLWKPFEKRQHKRRRCYIKEI
jgi:GNAT superfamily N-acetyltransferase